MDGKIVQFGFISVRELEQVIADVNTGKTEATDRIFARKREDPMLDPGYNFNLYKRLEFPRKARLYGNVIFCLVVQASRRPVSREEVTACLGVPDSEQSDQAIVTCVYSYQPTKARAKQIWELTFRNGRLEHGGMHEEKAGGANSRSSVVPP